MRDSINQFLIIYFNAPLVLLDVLVPLLNILKCISQFPLSLGRQWVGKPSVWTPEDNSIAYDTRYIGRSTKPCYYRESMFIQMHSQFENIWISTSAATRSIFAVFWNVPFFIAFSLLLRFWLGTFVLRASQMPFVWRSIAKSNIEVFIIWAGYYALKIGFAVINSDNWDSFLSFVTKGNHRN